MPSMTPQQVKEHSECLKLRPKRDDVKGLNGYREFHKVDTGTGIKEVPGPAPDGYYEWAYKFPTSDGHGKLTRQAHEHLERTREFRKKDTERHMRNSAKQDRALLRDAEGRLRTLDPALAERTALRAGWSHAWRAGGISVERGAGGMLWRKFRGEWEPTGRIEAGVLGKEARKDVTQFDPDGNPWTWVDGEWSPA